MNLPRNKISHPWIALCVWFGFGVLLYNMGVTNGSLIIFDCFAGIAIYRAIISVADREH